MKNKDQEEPSLATIWEVLSPADQQAISSVLFMHLGIPNAKAPFHSISHTIHVIRMNSGYQIGKHHGITYTNLENRIRLIAKEQRIRIKRYDYRR